MLNQENKKLHIMEKAILSFGLTAILAIGLISMRTAEQQAEKRQGAAQAVWQGTDTLPVSTSAAEKRVKAQFPSISTKVEDNGSQKQYKIDATDADGNTFQLTRVNGEVTELIINGKMIPQKDFDEYLYIFDEIENRSHETAGEQKGQDKVALAEQDLQKAQEQLDAANQEQAAAQERLEQEQARQEEKAEQDAARQQEKLEEAQERQQDSLEKQQEAMDKATEAQQDKAEQYAARQQEILEKQQEAAEKQLEAAQKEQEGVEKRQETTEQRQEAAQNEAAAERDQQKNVGVADGAIRHIIHDMIANGLVESPDAVRSFSLDNNGLTLNGVRQAADAYQVLRMKYIKSATEHYLYIHSDTGTTTDVKQERN
jgi:hypothetical protein